MNRALSGPENFEGHEGRECGDHRTTGGRAWCFDCQEWCYPNLPCARCELPNLRALLKEVVTAFSSMPDAGLTDADPRWKWWMDTSEVRLRAQKVVGT